MPLALVLAALVAFLPSSDTRLERVAGQEGDFLRVHHVRLEGSSLEIGRELAELGRERHGCAPKPAEDPAAVRAQREWFAEHFPAQLARMRGAAEVFGVALDDALELDSLGYGTPFAGCTVAYYPPGTTADGRGVLARNFDFTTGTMDGRVPAKGELLACAEPYVLELHPSDAHASLALVAFDLFGVLDGINSEGLTVALLADDELLASGRARPSSGPRPGLDVLQVGRFLLDTCADVAEAEAALRSAPLYYGAIPCHYLVADRHGNAFVWENAVDLASGHVLACDGTPLLSTNYLQHLHPDPDELPADRDPLGLFGRQRTLLGRLAQQDELDLDEIRANAEHVGARGDAGAGRAPGRTLWRAYYFPEERRVEVDFHLGDSAQGERRSPARTFVLTGR